MIKSVCLISMWPLHFLFGKIINPEISPAAAVTCKQESSLLLLSPLEFTAVTGAGLDQETLQPTAQPLRDAPRRGCVAPVSTSLSPPASSILESLFKTTVFVLRAIKGLRLTVCAFNTSWQFSSQLIFLDPDDALIKVQTTDR